MREREGHNQLSAHYLTRAECAIASRMILVKTYGLCYFSSISFDNSVRHTNDTFELPIRQLIDIFFLRLFYLFCYSKKPIPHVINIFFCSLFRSNILRPLCIHTILFSMGLGFFLLSGIHYGI